jgi:hypothetical protein
MSKVKEAHMQAFPFIEPEKDDNIKAYHPGMTMRDEFAKAAMQEQYWHDSDDTYLNHAERCYAIADAMMKARK